MARLGKIGNAPGKDLGLGFQAAKGAGVNHAIAVPLKVVAVGMRGLETGVRGIVRLARHV